MGDYETLRALLIPVHGVFGVLALLFGLIALSVPKRRPWHPRAGRIFLMAMALAIIVASPVIIAANNVFLMGLELLVVYHAAVAWRVARMKPPVQLPGKVDRIIHVVFAGVFIAFALWGIRFLIHGVVMGVVPVVLSVISLVSVRHFSRFMRRTSFQPGEWLPEHIRGMAAAFIASVTAFAAATGPRLVPGVPQVVLWLAPTIVLTPVFVWLGREVQRKLASKGRQA